MCCHHDRAASSRLIINKFQDDRPRGYVEAGYRLVEQQNVTLLRESLSDKHTLTLTSGKIMELLAG